MWRELSDVVHTAYGAVAGLLGPLAAVPLTMVFTFYQLIDALTYESPKETKEDIIEYAVGLVAGLALNHLLAWVLGR